MSEVITNPTAKDCFDTARMMLNDQNIQLWTDQVLMPMMKKAHLELQQKLKSRAAPVMRNFFFITVPPFNTGAAAQPPDITSPIQIWEKPAGAPISAFQLMTEVDVLPIQPPTNILTYWSWARDQIQFVGAALSTDVLIIYWRRVPVPTAAADPISIIDGDQYISPRIAALAAGSIGEEATSAVAQNLADSMIETVIKSNRGRAPQDAGASLRP